jgi:hypothetical protein
MVILIVVAAVSVVAVAATLRAAIVDGYRRVPTRYR